MKPSQELIDYWYTVADLMPFNSSGVRALTPCDVDEIPQPDDKGRLDLDGWRITWEGKVQPDWTNINRTLHGAAAAWIVDVCTSAAIMTHSTETFWGPPMPAGVSLALNMTYFHPAPVGTEILAKVVILKCSLTGANLQCDIIDKHTGKLYSSGTHIKAWRPARAKL